jgi:hypothetical protein
MTGWKTFVINMALTIFGALETMDLTTILGSKAGIVLSIIGIVNMVLRSITKTPIFKTE